MSWMITAQGRGEYEFATSQVPRRRWTARIDHGRDDADFEMFLRNALGDEPVSGWTVEVPEKWRGRPGGALGGVKFLKFESPDGRVRILDFDWKPGPWRLVRALEGRYAKEAVSGQVEG